MGNLKGLNSILTKMQTEFTDNRYAKSKYLQKEIIRALRDITSYYKKLIIYNKLSAYDKWIYDNYYTIDKAAKEVYRSLENEQFLSTSEDNLPDVFVFLNEALFEAEFNLDENGILKLIEIFERKRYLRNFEFDFLKTFLQSSAVILIAQTIVDSDDGKKLKRFQYNISLLFSLNSIDFERINMRKNRLEQLLSLDYSGVYKLQNKKTRSHYRYMVSKSAFYVGCDELTLAKELLAKSKTDENNHIGFRIYDYYNTHKPQNPIVDYHLKLCFFLPTVSALLLSGVMGNVLFSLLLYFPLYELWRPLIEYICLRSNETAYPPRLELHDKVPRDLRTLVVISTLLPCENDLPKLYKKLEEMILQNNSGAVGFCLLCDLKSAKQQYLPEDNKDISAVKKIVKKLNRKYNDSVLLVVRNRTYSKTQDEYTGYERKHGAITDLISLMHGKNISLAELYGDMDYIYHTKYILTLDYDTSLKFNIVSKLVSIAAHPLNKPVIDKEKGIVKSGYGIIAPRITTSLKSSLRSYFSLFVGGIGGTTTYDTACCELYQDIYNRAIFSGKGLIDVDVYNTIIPKLFLDETLLSHDIIEGGFLKTLYVGDAELIDSFPHDGVGFFKRLHRWIRGDFQNTAFIGKKVRMYQGVRGNPLHFVVRFQLFDNLRRALTPFFSMLAVIACLFVEGKAQGLLLTFAVLSVISPYLHSLIGLFATGSISAFTTRFYSKLLPRSMQLMVTAFFHIAMLPQFAFNAIDGSIRGIYRRFISKRGMLEWSTAAQVDSKSHSAIKEVRFYLPQIIFGVLLLLLGGLALKIIGTVFLLTVPMLFLLKKSPICHCAIDEGKSKELKKYLGQMFSYYIDFAGEKDNFLPPDNMQTAPVYRIAHRTSPTNIGLMLLSFLTARDFLLIDTNELYRKTIDTISTVERLKKYNGNLYNWYDTKTLDTLKPEFVSTVDSGNFVCCLVALKEGLRDYSLEDKRIDSLIKRVEKLICEVDLRAFYDKRKKLFTIGLDVQSNTFSGSHYDMLMSEARMMSYFAIAKRQVGVEHWAALSRTLSQSKCHTGPISWTGTMFEYFMPELLLHNINGSIGYEALRYCIHCQKERAERTGTPYGISESAIYKFDNELNYQYSPNGVQKIALKRGMDDELVVSPYSSFLTLGFDFDYSYNNLRYLKKLGATGKYGYYEALDYTKSRALDNRYMLIKSYMAHHIGMSIVAVNNALNGNIMQKRFLRDSQMNSATELLNEKIAVGEIVFRDLFRRKAKERQNKASDSAEYVGELFAQQPRVKLLTNTDISCVLCDSGTSFIKTKSSDILRRPTDLLRNPKGSFCYVKCNDKIFPTTFAPSYCSDICYETAFSKSSVEYFAKSENLNVKTTVRLHSNLACEQRSVNFTNIGNEVLNNTLIFYLEPSLFPKDDDEAHPAFSKLFIHVEYDAINNIVLASRKKRGSEEIFHIAVGFLEEVSFDLEANRENLFKRTDISSVKQSAFTDEFSDSMGIPDPVIAIRTKLELEKSASKTLTLITSVAGSSFEAMKNLIYIRRTGAFDEEISAKSKFNYASLEHRVAQTMLPQIIFNKRDSNAHLDKIAQNTLNSTALWQIGISADYPIVVVDIYSAVDTERVTSYLKCHSLLRLSFVEFDLVFLYAGQSDISSAIKQAISKFSNDDMISARAGVHIIDKTILSDGIETLIYAAACHIATRSLIRIEAPVQKYKPVKIYDCQRGAITANSDLTILGGKFNANSFFVTDSPKLPWCHVLANQTFGTLLSDKALGFTWAVNARENKLTPWFNDTMRDNTGEMLILKINDRYFDIINGSTAEFSPAFVKYHSLVDSLEIVTTVKVPAKGMIKYIEVEILNTIDTPIRMELAYYTEPVLGFSRQFSHQIQSELLDKKLLLHNPFNRSLSAYMAIATDCEDISVCCDRASFLCGRWNMYGNLPFYDNCATIIVNKEVLPKSKDIVNFQMAFSTTKQGVLSLINIKPAEEYHPQNRIQVNSNDKSIDALVNTWLPWQIVSSRIFGRTGFYQCGGAYGFRDQLQDVCGYMLLSPQLARQHIFRCCASQFEEGDVFHWWHTLPKNGADKKGVRTRYSDDMVWLPYTLSQYILKTNDYSILDVKISYLTAPKLADNQKDCYMQAVYTDYKESVYEHCKRALSRAHNLGEHGLIKIGSGDWNDGYSNVGSNGDGESVWLTQFLAHTMTSFANICDSQSDMSIAKEYRETAKKLLTRVDETAWDGEYYLRAFYDDGDKMGSRESAECRIDSLPQSFSVIAQMPFENRVRTAITAAFEQLVDKKHGIIKLFTPSFDTSAQNPGYVKAYPKGVRENGGQYTHAAVWLAIATCLADMPDKFFCLTQLLNPIKKYENKDLSSSYLVEPYYMTADIYTNESVYGRGGWSIYTGTASWYYQLLVENLFGIKFQNGEIELKPMLPQSLYGAEIEILYNGKNFNYII